MGGVLARVYSILEIDVKQMPFDWVDSTTRELAVCINCGMESVALKFFSDRGIVALCETLVKALKFQTDDQKLLLSRVMNILAKVCKVEESCLEAMRS